MKALPRIPCRWLSAQRRVRRICGIVLGGLMLAPAHAADDGYLRLLDQEVTKVEVVTTDTAGDSDRLPSTGDRRQAAPPAPARVDFETLLRRQHLGTYSFYSRLPERIREEVFLDYSSGASMEALRGKIIDRYLHP